MTSRLPKLVAFDLDYTLWPFWIESFRGPLRPNPDNPYELRDSYDDEIMFFHATPGILHRLRAAGVVIAACSRTHATELAREALSLLLVQPRAGDTHAEPQSAIEFFDHLEIYPGSKISHFQELHRKTGMPYSEMLFFDDEKRNREVESLGVTFQLNEDGINDIIFEQGLGEWRRRHPDEVLEDAGN
ncbi:magnesium-dependent phosphatase-1 [Gloeopeniophorella convolvens]|nr:magnesium-dependent phosphatase-1 [Gloeopeniophorella convolvens]